MNADGGPAFPRPPFTPWTRHDNAADAGFASTGHPGVSLRDWFAGQALVGFMADPEQTGSAGDISRAAYSLADAMLRARERGQEGDEENKALRDRVAQLEGVNDAALNTIDAAVGAVQRLSALDSYAKQVIDDDAWALHAAVTIHPTIGTESIHPTTWTARYWDGVRTLEESALTIVEAIRALRAKVEGGGR